jgi:catechol 2,3-dioxygenase-like lactoylglutathione lyase family enzyme
VNSTNPLGEAKVVAFVGTSRADRARAFYRDTLGLKLISEDNFALVFDVSGTMLRVALVPHLTPAAFTVLGWQVPDVAATVRNLQEAGVALERYHGIAQDELGIWTAPGGARVAWFKDPDGNILSVTQF